MKKEEYILVVLLAGMLLLPISGVNLYHRSTTETIWLVNTDNGDTNTVLAVETFIKQIENSEIQVAKTSLECVFSNYVSGDSLVIVGHGQQSGLLMQDILVSWPDLYRRIAECELGRTVVLACNSPSDEANAIFGFSGRIDAESGAILASLILLSVLDKEAVADLPFSRVAECQKAMLHPLGRVLYLVHGYWGKVSDMESLRSYLQTDLGSSFSAINQFSYFTAYGVDRNDMNAVNNLHYTSSVTDYAEHLYDVLIQHSSGTQINFVGHSLGGIIIRTMLMNHRTDLENAGIDIGCVVTMGTPNHGTLLANPLNPIAIISTILPLFADEAQYWPSPVFYSVNPLSPLMLSLNYDPSSYSDGIRWYTGAGIDPVLGLPALLIHGEYSDPLVGESRAYLSFAETRQFYDVDHSRLVVDETNKETYDDITDWVRGPDSDGDGLDNDAEIYVYGTDPNDWDSDNDGLSDGNEVLYHGTSPTAWSTDGDILSDGNEISWGYDPLSSTDPIPASSLIYSSWQYNGVTGYVRANHYSAMDYVKVSVRYKTSAGYWTGYMNAGTDYTPYTSGDYYVSWSLLQGYVQMQVMVQAYDSQDHYLGSDTIYVTLPGGGGGGGGPVPE
ncbi:MAG: hypothetical protein P1Q69_00120 [Candidatus Thorarchaeota archaeon]|nr:hypothetical protein [Candidatus Thorarchaeota archaeon]